MAEPKPAILVTSGYIPQTLAAMREHWHVIDIPDHGEALAYMKRTERLPLAVSVGHAMSPEGRLAQREKPIASPLPAHVMLHHVQEIDRDLPVIISTGESSAAAIVDLVKRGAFDYVIEVQRDATQDRLDRYTQEMVLALTRAAQWRQTVLENRQLRRQAQAQQSPSPFRARSPVMLRLLEQLQKVAPTPATVLVTGESGTGKELAAREVHRLSDRSDKPFIAINCGALSESLLTSELFGHVRGAFTGAESDREGLLRQAGEGTLFLDEIATVPQTFQVMLLRVLEERVARAVGAAQDYPVRCRFVAAANRDLAQAVRRGKFREDLYYRLNVFHLTVPPLRKRPEDIAVLARHFLQRACETYSREISHFEPAAMELLEAYSWPGNVRQLRNAIERAVILAEGDRVTAADLAAQVQSPAAVDPLATEKDYAQAMRRFEGRLLRSAIERAGGNLSEAARLLNMKRTTLHYRVKQLGL